MKRFIVLFVSVLLLVCMFAITFSTNTTAGEKEVEYKNWVDMQPPVTPGIKICALMVYDTESDKIILFGGFTGERGSDETWAYDYETNTWTNMKPDPHPPGRFGPGFVYDPKRDLCILYGGMDSYQGNSTYFDDTWTYDYNSNTWTQLSPTASPSKRCKGGTAYDIKSEQMVWFGGYGPDGVNKDETWTFNLDENTWVNKTSDVRPPARKRNPLMYDEQSDLVVMFGGWKGGEEVFNDLWVYDFNSNTWTEKDFTGGPHKRCRYGRAYIPERDVIVYTHGYGGVDGDMDDTWAYDCNENTWSKVEMTGTPPAKRHCFQVAYNEKHDVIIFQGGSSASAYDDTFAFKPYDPLPEEEEEASPVVIFAIVGIVAFIILIIIIIIVIKIRKNAED